MVVCQLVLAFRGLVSFEILLSTGILWRTDPEEQIEAGESFLLSYLVNVHAKLGRAVIKRAAPSANAQLSGWVKETYHSPGYAFQVLIESFFELSQLNHDVARCAYLRVIVLLVEVQTDLLWIARLSLQIVHLD